MTKYFTLSDSLDVNEFFGTLEHNKETWETEWGNPYITRDYISGIKSLGFGGICLPVTFFPHIKWKTEENNNELLTCVKIDSWFFERIKEIVSYITECGMKCIIRIHHDTDWLQELNVEYVPYVIKKYKALIDLFMSEFSYFDEELVAFECFNEVGFLEEEAERKELFLSCSNYFVQKVRQVNPERKLILQGVYADAVETVKNLKELSTIMDENCYIGLHWYYPRDYTLTDDINVVSKVDISDFESTNTKEVEALKEICQKCKVVISEYGCTIPSHDDVDIYRWYSWCQTLFDTLGLDRAAWMEKPGRSVIDRETLQENVPGILDTLI